MQPKPRQYWFFLKWQIEPRNTKWFETLMYPRVQAWRLYVCLNRAWQGQNRYCAHCVRRTQPGFWTIESPSVFNCWKHHLRWISAKNSNKTCVCQMPSAPLRDVGALCHVLWNIFVLQRCVRCAVQLLQCHYITLHCWKAIATRAPVRANKCKP